MATFTIFSAGKGRRGSIVTKSIERGQLFESKDQRVCDQCSPWPLSWAIPFHLECKLNIVLNYIKLRGTVGAFQVNKTRRRDSIKLVCVYWIWNCSYPYFIRVHHPYVFVFYWGCMSLKLDLSTNYEAYCDCAVSTCRREVGWDLRGRLGSSVLDQFNKLLHWR